MDATLAFLLGLILGVVFGMVVQWVADLPREHKR